MPRSESTRLPDFDRRRAEALVTRMMAIPGQSCEEAEIARFIITALREAGAPARAISHDRAHRVSAHGGQVGNLVFRLPGTIRGPRRLLIAHMDTVPICLGSRPQRRGQRLVSADPDTGLGADNRGGAAAILHAALEILERDLPHPPLTFLWPVQEELGLVGARHVEVSRLGKPRMAFNFDGGSPAELVIGATGALRMSIEIKGIASHAGVHPERGVNAITVAALAIAALERGGWLGGIKKRSQRGTSNVGVIEAGNATNVVTESARLRAEMRSHDRSFRSRIVKAYKEAFRAAARKVSNERGRHARVRFELSRDYEAFALAEDDPCVEAAAGALRAARLTPVYRIVDGGLDANWLNVHGIPTVSMGAGQRHIHTTAETLQLGDFFTACGMALFLAQGG